MADEQRISVSRDALRAELAEMELRLRIFMSEQLAHKADASQVRENTSALRAITRGEFSPAHRLAIEAIISEQSAAKTDEGWTARERVIGVVALFIAVLGLALSTYVGLAAASNKATPSAPNAPAAAKVVPWEG